MISIKSFAKKRILNTSSNGGVIVNNGNNTVTELDMHTIFGHLFNGTQDVEGDITVTDVNASGTINGNTVNAETINGGDVNATYVTTDGIEANDGAIDELHTNTITSTSADIDNATIDEVSGNTATYTNGNITNLSSSTIDVQDLNVNGTAHFFQLVIDKIKASGGSVILSPADGFVIDKVERNGNYYILLWRASHDGKAIANTWEVGDQCICQTINAAEGTSYNVSNKYYWAVVRQVGTRTISNIDYHYIIIPTSGTLTNGTVNPAVGDEIAMLGNRSNTNRQSAIYLCAANSLDGTLVAPFIAQYQGINDFNLSSHKVTWFAANGTQVMGNYVLSDGTPIEDVINVGPQIIVDSSLVTIYADENGAIESLDDVKGLPTKIQIKLNNQIIPTSEVVEGYDHSEIEFQGSVNPLQNTHTAPATGGITIASITKNQYDYTFTYRYSPQLGTTVNGNDTKYTVEFVHDGVTYNVTKTIPTILNKGGSYGEDGEMIVLEAVNEKAVVNANATVEVDFAYHIKHVIGNTITYETATLNGYRVVISDDNGQVHTLSVNDDEPYYFNNSYFVNYHTATSRPTYFDVELYDANDVVLDRKVVPIIFDAAATLTIKDEINATVQGNYNSLDGRITTNTNSISNINVSLNGITSTVNGHTTSINNLTNRVTQTEDNVSEIEQTMSSITSTVEQHTRNFQDVNDSLYDMQNEINTCYDNIDTVTDRVSQVEQTASAITTTVSEHTQRLDNLLLGNKNYFGFSKNIIFENVIPSVELYGFETTATSPFRISNIFEDDFESGDYTISFDVKSNGETFYMAATLCAVASDIGNFEINSEWQHITLHFKIDDNNVYLSNGTNGRLIITNKASDKDANRIYIKNLKIERATVPTQFSISYEDAFNFGNGDEFETFGYTNIQVSKDEKDNDVYTTTAKPTSSTSISYIAKGNVTMSANTPYTLTFMAKADLDNVIIRSRFANEITYGTLQSEFISNHNQSITNVNDNLTKVKLTTDWKRYNIHFFYNQDVSGYLHILGIFGGDSESNTNAVVQLKDIHFEKGYLEGNGNSTSSMIRQTAKDITLQVMGETTSLIQLTEDNIKLAVENCGINIDEQNITLNGDTVVNGSLTLNDDEERGFILNGESGRTEILSKSIGTYDEFTNQSSINIQISKIVDIIPTSKLVSYNVTKILGTVSGGTLVKFTNQSITFRGYNSGTIYQPSMLNVTYKLYVNDTLVRQTSTSTSYVSNIFTYTTQTNGLVKVEINVMGTVNTEDKLTCSFNCVGNIPTTTFTLLGNDGFASNFGNNSTVYFGKQQAVLKYGNNGIRVNSDGVKKLLNNTWVNLSTMNVRTISTDTTLGNDEEFVIANNASGTITFLLDTNVYEGRVVYLKGVGNNFQIRSAQYGIRQQTSKTPTTSAISINERPMICVYGDNAWNLFYCG